MSQRVDPGDSFLWTLVSLGGLFAAGRLAGTAPALAARTFESPAGRVRTFLFARAIGVLALGGAYLAGSAGRESFSDLIAAVVFAAALHEDDRRSA